MTTHQQTWINAPFGGVAISLHDGRLQIDLLTESLFQKYQQQSCSASEHPLIQQARKQIQCYLSQAASSFDLPLDLKGTEYQQRVWRAIATIPFGKTRTYGQLAKQIGSGPRAVANACGANPVPLVIPCHRVVAQDGIGGFMQGQQGGLRIKLWLLAHEGINGY